ncbi:5'-nucleotidase C-terminal domain-containing protein [Demequina sp.]|uniref:5'-nucleotidase C-terminal domain-containing protein n=1 Tax=Demequina sp. TaxID=2050685 RepID=UPI003D115F30
MTKTSSWRAFAVVTASMAALVAAIATPAQADDGDTTIQILGINDFHGRILPDPTNGGAGGASLVTAVDTLRAEHPNTVFAAAGDLIGASTFESFIAHDKPTIDVLNEAGLEVSAVGNHEFDQGYNDLVDRVMAPYDAVTNPYGGASWQYLGANVRVSGTNAPALPETWTETFGDVTVGFIGVVTDETPSLVSPDGVAGLTFEKEFTATNRSAADLKAAGADLVIALIHEGAPTTAYADAVNPANDFGQFVTSLSDDVDAVISGHTHLAYNHLVPVPGWADRAVTERPVVSAGQYGANLNQLLFTVNAAGDVTGLTTSIIDLEVGGVPVYPADPTTAALIQKAVIESDVLGAEVLGAISGPLYRAKTATGTSGSSRGGESTLGNAVAEIQRWATAELGAKVAFMNPGGLRDDMLGLAGGTGTYPSDITYKQAALVQPFANTLVTMDMTGAQIKAVLEQQWQPAGASRPFLRLGTSEGFTYTYDPTTKKVLDVRLNGKSIADTAVLKVTVNSFLASGGDNFTVFKEGANKADSGRVDLQAQVDYLAANGTLNVPTEQHAVGVTGLAAADFTVGKDVTLGLTSLMMTGAGDVIDANVTAKLGKVSLGSFAVTNVPPTDVYDEHGTATLAFTVPKVKPGDYVLTVKGKATGTVVKIPVTVKAAPVPPCVVSYKTYDKRHGEYFARVSVKNTSKTTVKDWKVEWTFAGADKVKHAWGAKLKQSGATVTATGYRWHDDLRSGHSATFGFTSKGAASDVAQFTLNGQVCVTK